MVAGRPARDVGLDREGALHAGGGRPTDVFAAFCGQLRVGWHLCNKGDAEAKGAVERLQGYAETDFEPGRSFARHTTGIPRSCRLFPQAAQRRALRGTVEQEADDYDGWPAWLMLAHGAAGTDTQSMRA